MNKLFLSTRFFIKAEEGGFWILSRFSRMSNKGDDMQQAYEMAVEALGAALVSGKEKEQIPDSFRNR